MFANLCSNAIRADLLLKFCKNPLKRNASYSGGPGVQSWVWRQAILSKVLSWLSSVPPSKCRYRKRVGQIWTRMLSCSMFPLAANLNLKLFHYATEGLGWRYSSYSFSTSALDAGEWSASRPGRTLPRGKDPRHPLYRRLSEPQSRSGYRGYRKNPFVSAGDRTSNARSSSP
jgi:hypothetical protein